MTDQSLFQGDQQRHALLARGGGQMAVMAIFRLLLFEPLPHLHQRLADSCQLRSQFGFFCLLDHFLLSKLDPFFFCCHFATLSALVGFDKPSRTSE